MASNPYVNKVQLANGTTLIDLSVDTAVASDVAQGKYFHLATGERVAGTASGGGTETIIIPEQTITVSSAYTQIIFSAPFVAGEQYKWTVNGTTNTGTASSQYGSIILLSKTGCVFDYSAPNMYFDVNGSSYYGTYTIKVVQESGGGGSTLIEKSITSNGVYNASDDDADGYSKVTVNVSGGSSKNAQYYTGRDEKNVGSYTATNLSITVSKAGTYKCYWVMDRNTTSGTSGSRLYNGDTALGSEHTTWSNTNNTRVQQCEETLTFAANDVITVRVRARNTSYYCGASNFFIVEQ